MHLMLFKGMMDATIYIMIYRDAEIMDLMVRYQWRYVIHLQENMSIMVTCVIPMEDR